jgi:acyl carrier protein
MKIEEYLDKFNNKNYDLSLKEFLLVEEAMNKNIIIEEEIKYQESTFDGIFYNIDLKLINFIIDIEKTFNIIINDYEVENIKSINDLIKKYL